MSNIYLNLTIPYQFCVDIVVLYCIRRHVHAYVYQGTTSLRWRTLFLLPFSQADDVSLYKWRQEYMVI